MSRKAEALEYITERIVRTGICPTLVEIAGAMKPKVSVTRAQQLVTKLEADKALVRRPGAQRALTLPDLEAARARFIAELGKGLQQIFTPCTNVQLPVPPELEHIPDIEWPGVINDR